MNVDRARFLVGVARYKLNGQGIKEIDSKIEVIATCGNHSFTFDKVGNQLIDHDFLGQIIETYEALGFAVTYDLLGVYDQLRDGYIVSISWANN
jgi:hypothetical protein